MPSIERKSVDRLGGSDRLLVDAGILARAGRGIDEKLIRLLGTHKVAVVPVIKPTYEERKKIVAAGMDEDKFIMEVVGGMDSPANRIRSRLAEQLKSVYIPFSETDRAFCARGKKKQITEGVLLSPDPGPLYQEDIDAGSRALLTPVTLKNLEMELDRLYEIYEDGDSEKNKSLPATFHSIRLHSIFSGDRLQTAGDALVWHSVDCALMFLSVMAMINRQRIQAGGKPSTKRFNPEKPSFQQDIYYYDRNLIVEAALGILIHALGFCQLTVHATMSAKPVITGESRREQELTKILRRNYNVTRNLMRNREDISPISRMMITGQYDYPDGTGYPPTDRNYFLHEFLRLFHIIDCWDELTNPVLGKIPYSRHEALQHIEESAGTYSYRREEKIYCPKFDETMVSHWKKALRPYSPGEKVYIYPPDSRNNHVYVGRVYNYTGFPIPLISILKDERTGRSYPHGKVLLSIPRSAIYIRSAGKKPESTKNAWLSGLKILESQPSEADITGFHDVLYGTIRKLPRKR